MPINDKLHSGCPSAAGTDENIEKYVKSAWKRRYQWRTCGAGWSDLTWL